MTQSPCDSPLVALDGYEPGPELLHSIEAAARMTHVPRRLIALYCRHGLVAPVMDPEAGGWFFNDDGIRALRRIEHLRLMCGMNFTAIRLVLELLDEVERLQRELRFLRRR
jgi:DNA-binding transcriptional MerR regulator